MNQDLIILISALIGFGLGCGFMCLLYEKKIKKYYELKQPKGCKQGDGK